MSQFARVFLLILPLGFAQGCGGGASGSPQAAPEVNAAAPVSENRAPTISGVPDRVAQVGQTYDFQPEAADPDGDALTFSATNLPPWARIDPTSGRISGTPGPNDRGLHESIFITVADASRTARTADFSITVVGDVGTGVASLRWEPPPSKLDGTPLDDLAGYRILYGRSSSSLDYSVYINDPATTSFEFTTLSSGIWYFTVVAVNASGLEGPPTTVTTKSI